MTRRLVMAALALALALAAPAIAQRPARPLQQRGQGRDLPPDRPGRRAELEGEVRRRFARIVRERVGLNDAQMQQLGPVTQRHEEQRRRLQNDERDARQAMRTVILGEATPDSAKVEQLIERLKDVQRRRVALMDSEDKDLATFMSPIQRAKYLALQENFRRQLEQMRPPQGPPFDPPPPAA